MLQASIATFKVMNTLYSMMRVAQSPSAWELVVRIMWCLHSSHWWRSSALQISAVIGVLGMVHMNGVRRRLLESVD